MLTEEQIEKQIKNKARVRRSKRKSIAINTGTLSRQVKSNELRSKRRKKIIPKVIIKIN